jgi:hypothetical protein
VRDALAADARDGERVDPATIALVGLSHHTAPIELREQVYVDAANVRHTVREVMESPAVHECVVLSTCNRTEFYLHAADPASAEAVAIEAVAARSGMSPGEVEAYLYHRHGHEGVLHLFRVAAGLDSLVVGEAEILGQVGDAYEMGLYRSAMPTRWVSRCPKASGRSCTACSNRPRPSVVRCVPRRRSVVGRLRSPLQRCDWRPKCSDL